MNTAILHPVEYAKPRRLVMDGARIPEGRAHRYLPEKDARYLLKGKVIVEEKMDGTPASFVVGNQYIAFCEDMRRRHSIAYRVPGRYAVFDIFDTKRGVFVFSEEKAELSLAIRKGLLRAEGAAPADFFPVAVVAHGVFVPAELPALMGISGYAFEPGTGKSAPMEGIVIKPDRDLYPEEQLRAKLVRPEFDREMDEHHLRRPEVRNIIDPGTSIIVCYNPLNVLGAGRFYS